MAYATTEQFRTLRDITSYGDDLLIEALISRAQAAIDRYCHRKFEGSAANRTFDAGADVEGAVLWVYSAGDLASITTVTNGDGATIASSAYVTEPRNAVARGIPIVGIRLKSGTYWRAAGGQNENAITINGVWAYSAIAPADIVQATLMLANYYYDQRMSSGGEIAVIPGVSVSIPQGMPAAVKQLLAPYVRII